MNFIKPVVRTRDLVVQEHGDEILIYDLTKDRAMCLNTTAAAVWRACDGTRTVSDLAALVGSDDVVWLALAELKKEELIDQEPATPEKFSGMSRRQVMKRIGLSSVIAVPVIMSLLAPPAHAAASTCSAGNPPGPGVGSGGTCYCSPAIPTGSTCGVGIISPLITNCKAGCTCTRTSNFCILGACQGVCG